MNLSNDGLVAFHYRSYGAFFLQQNRLHNIYRDLPTTNIIEPFKEANVYPIDLHWLSFLLK